MFIDVSVGSLSLGTKNVLIKIGDIKMKKEFKFMLIGIGYVLDVITLVSISI